MRGWYVTPARENGSTVVLFHGVTDNRLGVAGYGELFLSKGYSLLLPDARGHGESDGEIATYGVLEAEDVRRWVDLAYSSNTTRCVYGFGESMGAGIVMQSLRIEKRFCAVVEESGFAEFREAAYDRLGEKMDIGPWFGQTLMRPAIEFGILYARLKFGVNLTEASARSAVAQSSVPVLLIHGDADKNIRPRNADLIHQAAPSNTELWKVPDAAHCGAWAQAHEEFDRRVIEFFSSHTTRCDLGRCRL
jgi:pimeloyl-ACP methyl ester carboxylesterase